MRKALVTLTTVAVIVGFSIVPAHAFWTFIAHYQSGSVHCSGEPNDPNYAASCDIIASWGDEVLAYEDSGYCVASVMCNGVEIGCSAVETWDTHPAVCGSFSYEYFPRLYAVCKSDIGLSRVDCF